MSNVFQKNKNIILASSVAIAVISIGGIIYAVTRKTSTRYTVAKNKKYLFIGDSSTVGNPSYPEIVKKALPEFSYDKVAKVGADTKWMLSQLKEQDLSKYGTVVILGGYNDIYIYPKMSGTISNISQMIDLIHSAGLRVIVITPSPSGYHPNYNSAIQEKHDELNSFIMNSNADVKINNYKLVLAGDGKPDTKYVSLSDRQHYNLIGYQMLAKEFKKYV